LNRSTTQKGVELTLGELGEAVGAAAGAGPGKHGFDAHAVLGEPAAREARMFDGAAEDQSARAGVLAPRAPEALRNRSTDPM
jgi:hypothetical protein